MNYLDQFYREVTGRNWVVNENRSIIPKYVTSVEINPMVIEIPEFHNGIKKLTFASGGLVLNFTLDQMIRNGDLEKEVDKLPESLQELKCQDIRFKKFPELPSGLKKLTLWWCKQLPISFPQSLEELYINGYSGELTVLPKLPKSLKILEIRGNSQIFIPELPEDLWKLKIYAPETLTRKGLVKQVANSWQNCSALYYPEDVLPPNMMRGREYVYPKQGLKVSKYNKWLGNIRTFQCIYQKRILRAKKKEEMGKIIANWIYEYGIKPGGLFARMAIKRAYERVRRK